MQLYHSCITDMPKKDELLRKLTRKPLPTNFTVRELKLLMSKCGCDAFEGGRGSGIGFYHTSSGRILQFDTPHPGNELYRYQIKKTIEFLHAIGEL